MYFDTAMQAAERKQMSAWYPKDYLGLRVCGLSTVGEKKDQIIFFMKGQGTIQATTAVDECEKYLLNRLDRKALFIYQWNVAAIPATLMRVRDDALIATCNVGAGPLCFLLVSTREVLSHPVVTWSFAPTIPYEEEIPTFNFFVEVQVRGKPWLCTLIVITYAWMRVRSGCTLIQGLHFRYLDKYRYVVVFCPGWLPKFRRKDGVLIGYVYCLSARESGGIDV